MSSDKIEMKKATIVYGGLAARSYRVGKQSINFSARDPNVNKSPQKVEIDLPIEDGMVAQPTGGNLARLVDSGEIQVLGVRLPSIGAFKSRAKLMAEAEAA